MRWRFHRGCRLTFEPAHCASIKIAHGMRALDDRRSRNSCTYPQAIFIITQHECRVANCVDVIYSFVTHLHLACAVS
jgi:hypothetical protein